MVSVIISFVLEILHHSKSSPRFSQTNSIGKYSPIVFFYTIDKAFSSFLLKFIKSIVYFRIFKFLYITLIFRRINRKRNIVIKTFKKYFKINVFRQKLFEKFAYLVNKVFFKIYCSLFAIFINNNFSTMSLIVFPKRIKPLKNFPILFISPKISYV